MASPPPSTLHPTLYTTSLLTVTSLYFLLTSTLQVYSTGSPLTLLGYTDLPLQRFLNSAQYSDDTTPLNMSSTTHSPGQLFTRKLGGLSMLSLTINKLSTFVLSSHSSSASAFYGFHSVTISCSVISNLAIAAYLLSTLPSAPTDAGKVIEFNSSLLIFESIVMLAPLVTHHLSKLRLRDLFKIVTFGKGREFEGRTVPDYASHTVWGIVTLCTILTSLPFLRDFFAPGALMRYLPGDRDYLVFTRAYVHSPEGGGGED